MLLMFISAPASMAGWRNRTQHCGRVSPLRCCQQLRGLPQAVVFGRVCRLKLSPRRWRSQPNLVAVFGATLALMANTDNELAAPAAFEELTFSTPATPLGLTGDLGMFGRIMICITMFWGRLGPLTSVVLLAQRQRQLRYG